MTPFRPICLVFSLLCLCPGSRGQDFEPPYPPSDVVLGMSFDDSSARTLAPGSDIWPITWAADGHLYTSWGDGGGFGGTNREGRVSLGVARVERSKDDYRGVNIAGGKDAPNPAPFTGKSEGILAIGNTLYLWRDGERSDQNGFKWNELFRSDDSGATWRFTGVRFDPADFPDGDEGFFAPAFCQFGPGYSGARDDYVYIYAPDIVDRTHWDMRIPGRIHLIRVSVDEIEVKNAYRFYAGADAQGRPRWSPSPGDRRPTWTDERNGTHRIAVSYNAPLRRYLLSTITVNREGWMSVYESPEPWGPWRLVHAELTPERWGRKTILFTFVNKWLSSDGRDFVVVHTKDDTWSTIEGRFETASQQP